MKGLIRPQIEKKIIFVPHSGVIEFGTFCAWAIKYVYSKQWHNKMVRASV
jgi:hypothetical protein